MLSALKAISAYLEKHESELLFGVHLLFAGFFARSMITVTFSRQLILRQKMSV